MHFRSPWARIWHRAIPRFAAAAALVCPLPPPLLHRRSSALLLSLPPLLSSLQGHRSPKTLRVFPCRPFLLFHVSHNNTHKQCCCIQKTALRQQRGRGGHRKDLSAVFRSSSRNFHFLPKTAKFLAKCLGFTNLADDCDWLVVTPYTACHVVLQGEQKTRETGTGVHRRDPLDPLACLSTPCMSPPGS